MIVVPPLGDQTVVDPKDPHQAQGLNKHGSFAGDSANLATDVLQPYAIQNQFEKTRNLVFPCMTGSPWFCQTQPMARYRSNAARIEAAS